ncbi:hypothetical protein D3C87_1452400 [compost metagenome]
MRFLDPADVDVLERLDLVDVAPEAVEDELAAGHVVDDPVVGDRELGLQAKAFDLDLEQRVDALLYLVLELAGAEEADPVVRRQEDREARGVPALRRGPSALQDAVAGRRLPEVPQRWIKRRRHRSRSRSWVSSRGRLCPPTASACRGHDPAMRWRRPHGQRRA